MFKIFESMCEFSGDACDDDLDDVGSQGKGFEAGCVILLLFDLKKSIEESGICFSSRTNDDGLGESGYAL